MQIYRDMTIGTDKPSPAQRQSIAHHMLDIIPPTREFSVSDYQERAYKLIRKILRAGNCPIFVGGTGLYVKAVVDGLSPHPGKDDALRDRLEREAEAKGAPKLHERLRRVDPVVAARVHPHDAKRIIRALEVYKISGKRLSDWEKETVSLQDKGYRPLIFGLNPDRAALYAAIDARVERMFRKGLKQEVEGLSKRALSRTARQAIGYRQLFDYFEGRCSLEAAKDQIKQSTRNYAKRQVTWFRADKRVHWLTGTTQENIQTMMGTVLCGTLLLSKREGVSRRGPSPLHAD